MAAQQKPKSSDKKGSRNSNRRNGKAFKKRPGADKPTGRTVCGYSLARVVNMAEKFGLSFDEMVKQLKVRREMKRHSETVHGYKGRLSTREALGGIPVQRKSRPASSEKVTKPTVISRKHDWYRGDLFASNINMRCRRDGCETIWLPWQTEIMKGECSGADAKAGAA